MEQIIRNCFASDADYVKVMKTLVRNRTSPTNEVMIFHGHGHGKSLLTTLYARSLTDKDSVALQSYMLSADNANFVYLEGKRLAMYHDLPMEEVDGSMHYKPLKLLRLLSDQQSVKPMHEDEKKINTACLHLINTHGVPEHDYADAIEIDFPNNLSDSGLKITDDLQSEFNKLLDSMA